MGYAVNFVAVNSKDLTSRQAAQLSQQLAPAVRYLRELHLQMDEQGFPIDDKLRKDIERAYDAVHHLSVSLHQLSGGSGAGERKMDREPL